jgi:hypothetical protein
MYIYDRKCTYMTGNVRILQEMYVYDRKCKYMTGNVRIWQEMYVYYRKCTYMTGNVNILYHWSHFGILQPYSSTFMYCIDCNIFTYRLWQKMRFQLTCTLPSLQITFNIIPVCIVILNIFSFIVLFNSL